MVFCAASLPLAALLHQPLQPPGWKRLLQGEGLPLVGTFIQNSKQVGSLDLKNSLWGQEEV